MINLQDRLKQRQVGPVQRTFGNALHALAGHPVQDNQDDLAEKIALLEYQERLKQNPLDDEYTRAKIDKLKDPASVASGIDENGKVIYSTAPSSNVKIMPAGLTPAYQNQAQARADAAVNKENDLPPSRQNAKDKRTEALIGMVEQNDVKRTMLRNAETSLPKIPTGLFGKVKTEYMKRFDPNNPTMTDWQNVKMIGTDAQLMNTALTKGAISDQEMRLFSQAAANDDISSVARLKPVLEKLKLFIDAEESASMKSYKQIYDEDPMSWPEMSARMKSGNRPAFFQPTPNSQNTPSFNSPEEADASGLPPGTKVNVNGRPYEI